MELLRRRGQELRERRCSALADLHPHLFRGVQRARADRLEEKRGAEHFTASYSARHELLVPDVRVAHVLGQSLAEPAWQRRSRAQHVAVDVGVGPFVQHECQEALIGLHFRVEREQADRMVEPVRPFHRENAGLQSIERRPGRVEEDDDAVRLRLDLHGLAEDIPDHVEQGLEILGHGPRRVGL